MSLFEELKRRNVLRVAVVYLAGGWLLIQVVETVFPIFGLSTGLIRLVTVLVIIGFPITLLVSWIYDLTPEGFQLESEVGHSRPTQSQSKTLGQTTSKKSIAVLPFADVSPEANQEYFSDGISEQLRIHLAQVRGLRVISRFSSLAYKGKGLVVADIALALNVAHVLDGSVSKSGNRVRVTAQLIDANSDTLSWTHTYDRSLEDIFVVQDEIAESVVTELQVRLVGDVPEARPTDASAYSLYLQAQHIVLRGTADAYNDATQLLEQALSIDESYAPAWSALSDIVICEVGDGIRPAKVGFEDARHSANRALQLDPGLFSAHLHLARIASHYDWDYAAAAAHLKAARSGEMWLFRAADLAATLGRYELSEKLGRQAILSDPVSPKTYINLSNVFMVVGKFDEAEQVLKKAVALSPTNVKARWRMAMLRLAEDKPQAALDLSNDITNDEMQSFVRSIAYYAIGDTRNADEHLEVHKKRYADQSASNIAEVYAFREQPELMFKWLEKALEIHDGALADIRCNASFRTLRDHPEMQLFLAKIGLSDEQIAGIDLDLSLSEEPPFNEG